jgi:hypothetical protein
VYDINKLINSHLPPYLVRLLQTFPETSSPP